MRLINQAKFARRRKVSRARVSQWVAEGKISLVNGKVDVAAAELALQQNLDPIKRIDYEASQETPSPRKDLYEDIGNDKPPKPFTGNILRDTMIMALTSLYEYYLEQMIPLQLNVLQGLHLRKREAKSGAVCFAFKTHDIFKEFVEGDLFKKFLQEQIGENIDSIASQHMRTREMETFPPKDFQLYHPRVILDLLKELGPDWPFTDEKKTNKKGGSHHGKRIVITGKVTEVFGTGRTEGQGCQCEDRGRGGNGRDSD